MISIQDNSWAPDDDGNDDNDDSDLHFDIDQVFVRACLQFIFER
jgi:hypothetical protein